MNLIDKIIKEYQEHLAKENKTLGTLINDWKNELEEELIKVFEIALGLTQDCWEQEDWDKWNNYLKSKENGTRNS